MTVSLSEFADKIHEIMPFILKEFSRQQTKSMLSCDITLPQILILNFLNKTKKSKMKDIAKFMKVTTAAATGIVDRLVRADLVSRCFNEADRRIVLIKLTPKGSKLINEVMRQRKQFIMKVFGLLSEEDRQNYLNVLVKIKNILANKGD